MKSKGLMFSLVFMILLLAIMPIVSAWDSSSSIANGLISYWDFDETSGSLIDATGQGNNNATDVYGNTLYTGSLGIKGTTYTQTGTTDLFILNPDNFNMSKTNKMSLSFWIYMTGGRVNGKVIDKVLGFSMYSTTSQFLPSITQTGGTEIQPACSILPIDTWVHFVMVANGTNIVGYVNGTQKCSMAYDGTIGSSSNELKFFMASYTNYSIDETGIWNRSLSDSEIISLYNSGAGDFYEEADTTPPTITFLSKIPADMNFSNVVNNPVWINYSITDTSGVNSSTIRMHFKTNTTLSNVHYYQNGTAHEGYFNNKEWDIGYIELSNNYSFVLGDNEIHRTINNIGVVSIDNIPHTSLVTNSPNDYYLTQYYNFSNTASGGYLEVMWKSTTGTASPITTYYCNSSYTTGAINTNPNCVIASTKVASTTFNHCHLNMSCHSAVTFAINTSTGKMGNVVVTPTSYFAIGGAKDWNISYVNQIPRADMTKSSVNKGISWTTQAYSIDEHIHQFDVNTIETFYYFVSACDNLGNCANSSIMSDDLAHNNLAPSPITIISPTNLTYNSNFLINYTEAVSPQGSSIFYNISLLNTDYTFNQTIITDNSNNLTYLFNLTAIPNGEYVIRVTAVDIDNLKSNGYSEIFTINHSAIFNCEELQNMENDLSGNYFLMNNIDCSDTINWNSGEGFLAIGLYSSFSGTLDGQGYNITNLYINRTDGMGLFRNLGDTGSNTEIKNLGLIDIDITGTNNVGGLGAIIYNSTISNVWITGKVTGTESTGGLGGNCGGDGNYASITNSYFRGEVNGNGGMYIGGLCGGSYDGLINNSYVIGNVSGGNVGGLIGDEALAITTNSYFIGIVNGTTDVGGLIGTSTGTIDNCSTAGLIIGGTQVGGLDGKTNGGTITNSYSTGNVTGSDINVGGLIGYNLGTIINCSATGNVYSPAYNVGGLVGNNEFSIENSYATGEVTGLVGQSGGLVGSNNLGTINNSYSTGNVIGDIEMGGLVGASYLGIITNSYATGNVSGTDYIGGLAGDTYGGIVENCYSVGLVVGTTITGGLVGDVVAETTFTNSYWNKYLSNQTTSAGGTALSNTALLNQSSYVDWDFTNIWDIQTNSTPYLRFHPEPIIYNNLPADEEAVTEITSVIYDTPITLNGGTTKDIYIMFETSTASIDDTTAQVIATNGAVSRTSSSCTNSSTIFNCTIAMQFYDEAGTWDINASVKNLSGSYVENSTASFTLNALDCVSQNTNSIKWKNVNMGAGNVSAENVIQLTNCGNQNYPTINIKAFDIFGLRYGDLINAEKFSVSNNVSSAGSSSSWGSLVNGLVAYWNFNETSGSLIDITGQGNNNASAITSAISRGTLGKSGTAYSVYGVGKIPILNQPKFNMNLSGNGQFTLSTWISASALTSYNMPMGINQRGGLGQGQYQFALSGLNSVYGGVWTSAGVEKETLGAVTFNANQWYYMVLVGNGTDISLWIDGTFQKIVAYDGSLRNVSRDFELFYSEGESSNYTIDEASVWNRSLNDSDINFLYNSGAGNFYEPSTPPTSPNHIYLQNNTNVDVSSLLNLNFHNASATKDIYFFVDVPTQLGGGEYRHVNSWTIALTT